PSRASARATPSPMPRVPPVTRAVRSVMRRPEEREVRSALGEALHVEGRFTRVVVAPLTGLAARHTRSSRHVVPPVRPVIHGVQQQSLVALVGAHVRLVEDRVEYQK